MTPVALNPLAPMQASETLDEKFQRFASTRHQAVAHHSSSSIRYGHLAYQAIIKLGPAVVPLLLRDLEKTGRHWFVALATLTLADPVPADQSGNIAKMKEAWLQWGHEQGYL